ncbi:MAG: UTP--glucose-1-phosphate uridylyltransferase, partial [Nocardioides sp.]|nr:UTP--glucose-1-phosphate uridylyltransferase [Nocardioides sp.]
LLVLRSDIYTIGPDFVLDQVAEGVPYIDLDEKYYKLVDEFDKRFPDGAPSLKDATSLEIAGDWTFGHGVTVRGDVALKSNSAKRISEGAVLDGDDA